MIPIDLTVPFSEKGGYIALEHSKMLLFPIENEL